MSEQNIFSKENNLRIKQMEICNSEMLFYRPEFISELRLRGKWDNH